MAQPMPGPHHIAASFLLMQKDAHAWRTRRIDTPRLSGHLEQLGLPGTSQRACAISPTWHTGQNRLRRSGFTRIPLWGPVLRTGEVSRWPRCMPRPIDRVTGPKRSQELLRPKPSPRQHRRCFPRFRCAAQSSHACFVFLCGSGWQCSRKTFRWNPQKVFSILNLSVTSIFLPQQIMFDHHIKHGASHIVSCHPSVLTRYSHVTGKSRLTNFCDAKCTADVYEALRKAHQEADNETTPCRC